MEKININRLKQTHNTIDKLENDLASIRYNGGTSIKQEHVIELINNLRKHQLTASIYQLQKPEKSIKNRLINLLPSPLFSAVNTRLTNLQDSAQITEVPLLQLTSIILECTSTIQSRAELSTYAFSNAVTTMNNEDDDSDNTICTTHKAIPCTATGCVRSHTTADHNECNSCDKLHHSNESCRKKLKTNNQIQIIVLLNHVHQQKVQNPNVINVVQHIKQLIIMNVPNVNQHIIQR